MFSARTAVIALALVCLSPLAADAAGNARRNASKSCPAWRPCGPGETWGGNRFIPQGAYGVDARHVCQKHDECYDANGNRKDCDVAFYNELKCLCESSTNPRACKRAARVAYLGVRLLGSSQTEK